MDGPRDNSAHDSSATLPAYSFAQTGVGERTRERSARAVLHTVAVVATKRNAVIRTCCLRLLAAGNPKKLALVGWMRKLLTILNMMVRTAQR